MGRARYWSTLQRRATSRRSVSRPRVAAGSMPRMTPSAPRWPPWSRTRRGEHGSARTQPSSAERSDSTISPFRSSASARAASTGMPARSPRIFGCRSRASASADRSRSPISIAARITGSASRRVLHPASLGNALAASCKAWRRGMESSIRISTEAATSRCSRSTKCGCIRKSTRSWRAAESDCSSSPASCCCSRAATLRTCCSCAASRAPRSSRSARRSAATARQIGRPLLIEALLLSVSAARSGSPLRFVVAGRSLRPSRCRPTNSVLDVRFDYRMVVFSVLAALGTGCLFGLLPSWRAARRTSRPHCATRDVRSRRPAALPSSAARSSRAKSLSPWCSSRLLRCWREAS